MKIVHDAAPELAGTLIFALNAEGQSSHRCSRRIIDGHGVHADMGLLAIGTERIVIGHRGRVDVQVTIRGEPGHSSEPQHARNAIWGLKEALIRLDGLKQSLTGRHAVLGENSSSPTACDPTDRAAYNSGRGRADARPAAAARHRSRRGDRAGTPSIGGDPALLRQGAHGRVPPSLPRVSRSAARAVARVRRRADPRPCPRDRLRPLRLRRRVRERQRNSHGHVWAGRDASPDATDGGCLARR